MASVSVEISGMSAILTNENITMAVLQNKVDFYIQQAGKRCKSLAQASCSVGTPASTGKKNYKGGTLKKSIKYAKVKKFECTVTTNVNYSKYVEFGTYKMSAQPFLHPAYMQAFMELQVALGTV